MHSDSRLNPRPRTGFREAKKDSEMKTSFTFEEAGKIFSVVAKLEEGRKVLEEVTAQYEEARENFYSHFAERGGIGKVSIEDDELFEEIERIQKERDDAERKVYARIKTFAALIEDREACNVNIWEEEIRDYLDNHYLFRTIRMAAKCKTLAFEVARNLS